MTRQQVKDFMEESKSPQEWNDNCDHIKTVFGGYPDFWYSAIIMSGLYDATRLRWEIKKKA